MHRCVLVVPCHNEAQRLDAPRFARFAQDHPHIGFVMVDDGSTDATGRVLRQLASRAAQSFRVLDLRRNLGKAEAVRLGMLQALDAGPEFAGYWDADLAAPLDEIHAFLSALDDDHKLQLILGSRVRLLGHRIDRNPARHVLGRAFATAASLALRLPVYDTQCGAKLFRTGPNLRLLLDTPFRTGWVFDVELLARLARIEAAGPSSGAPGQGWREIPLQSWRDVPGSKVRPAAFIRSFFELARIAWIYRRPAVVAEEPLCSAPLRMERGASPRSPRPHSQRHPRKSA